jgi:hypothetical protein
VERVARPAWVARKAKQKAKQQRQDVLFD